MKVPDFTVWPIAAAGGFAMGCMAGSFLNVVAHRVPRGETVVHGRSHCPACGVTIRPWHNVPVLGWFLLRGRCRDCGAAISARYPLVEAACGGLLAVLATMELTTGDRPAAVVTAWTGHAAVALTLCAWALLADRGHAVSGFAVGAATGAAVLAAVFVPALAPLPVGCAGGAALPWVACLLASLTGLGTGWLCDAAAGGRAGAACGVVGAALGWQAALLAVVAGGIARAAWRQAAAAPAAAVLAVVCWHPVRWAWEGICRVAGAG